jgi:hypothetical protein
MATVSIQVPMLETKLPVQMVANARCRNGWKGDTRVGWAGLVTRLGYPQPGRPRPWRYSKAIPNRSKLSALPPSPPLPWV